jgi:hypothetical protein
MNVFVRGVDERLWRELRAEAIRRGKKTAEAINEAIKLWLEKKV